MPSPLLRLNGGGTGSPLGRLAENTRDRTCLCGRGARGTAAHAESDGAHSGRGGGDSRAKLFKFTQRGRVTAGRSLHRTGRLKTLRQRRLSTSHGEIPAVGQHQCRAYCLLTTPLRRVSRLLTTPLRRVSRPDAVRAPLIVYVRRAVCVRREGCAAHRAPEQDRSLLRWGSRRGRVQ